MLSRLLSDIRQFLQQCPELMFNERDFQMQLAVFLRLTRNYDDVDVEYFIPNSVAIEKGYEWKSDLRLDIVVRKGEKYAVVELKYHTRRIVKDIKRFNTLLPNVEVIKNHGAQDIVSYNFWKDVRRIEIIKALFPDNVEGGVAVMLTKDAYHLYVMLSQWLTVVRMCMDNSIGRAPQPPLKTCPHSLWLENIP